jgi:sugar lactone lactonase YvrE
MNIRMGILVRVGAMVLSCAPALAAPGDYVVTDLSCNCLRLVNHVTGAVSNFASGLVPASYGVAIDGAGNYVTSDAEGGRLLSVNRTNGTVSVLASNLNFPAAVAVDGAGDWVVTDGGSQRFYLVDPVSKKVTTNAMGTFGRSRGVAVDGAGNYILSGEEPNICTGGGTAYLLASVNATNGGVTTVVRSSLGAGQCLPNQDVGVPKGVAIGASGTYIMTDSFGGRLFAVTPAGVATLVAGGLGNPNGVAIAGNGNYIVTDSLNHRLLLVTPQGAMSTIASNGLVSPFGVVIEPTPPARITSIQREGNNIRVTWSLGGAGRSNAVQRSVGNASGGINPQNFLTVFMVTNAVGAVANYLDVGAVTNARGAYYRVRVVP